MGYKVLGYAVWNGAKWYLRRRYGGLIPSRRLATAIVVFLAVLGIAVAGAKRDALTS